MIIVSMAIATAAALFFMALGVAALVRPAIARAFLLGFANTGAKHYAELLARVVVGGSLLLIARDSAYSTALAAFGWLLIGTTAVMALFPWQLHHRFTQSAVPKALRFQPLMGITSLAFGAMLLWAIVAGRAP